MPEPTTGSLGSLLRTLRTEAALSQDELAARSGVSARAISDLERGQRTAARFETIRMLADGLALSGRARADLIRAANGPMIDATLRREGGPRPGLPVATTPLIGRERALAELVGALEGGDCRLVTLTGPGGIGKSRLAGAAAARAAPRFPAGAAWIDLAPLADHRGVIPLIAAAFDAPAESPIGSLHTLLAGGRFLLVLDNVEHVIDAAPAVAGLIAAAPNLTVLATSRIALGVQAERVFPVAPLTLPAADAPAEIEASEAVRLFVERARAGDPGFALSVENGGAVAEICRRLDGLPLAIELAASRAAVLPPRALLGRLEKRLPLLAGGFRDAPARQQTMTATIAWSYQLLDDRAKRLFRLLSVFSGGFTVDTVEFVQRADGAGGERAVEDLTALVKANVAYRLAQTADETRFTMYETIREYGLAQLAEHGELETASGLLVAYCRSFSAYDDGVPTCIVPEPWLAMVDRERENIRAAYRHVAAGGEPERLLSFAAAFGHYVYLRWPAEEALAWYERALAATLSAPTIERFQGLYWAGHLAAHVGRYDQAVGYANEALRLAEELADPAWQAATVHCLAMVETMAGDRERARALCERSLALWREAGEVGLSGFTYLFLGNHAYVAGDPRTARAYVDRAAAIFGEMGGHGWVALANWDRGIYTLAMSRTAEAATLFAASLDVALDHQVVMAQDRGLLGLAAVAAALGRHELAGELLGAAEASMEVTRQDPTRFGRELIERTLGVPRTASEMEAFARGRGAGAAADHARRRALRDEVLRAVRARERRDDRLIVVNGTEHGPVPHARAD